MLLIKVLLILFACVFHRGGHVQAKVSNIQTPAQIKLSSQKKLHAASKKKKLTPAQRKKISRAKALAALRKKKAKALAALKQKHLGNQVPSLVLSKKVIKPVAQKPVIAPIKFASVKNPVISPKLQKAKVVKSIALKPVQQVKMIAPYVAGAVTRVDFDGFLNTALPIKSDQQRFGLASLTEVVEFRAFKTDVRWGFGVTNDEQKARLYKGIKSRLGGGVDFDQAKEFMFTAFRKMMATDAALNFPNLGTNPNASFDGFLGTIFPILQAAQAKIAGMPRDRFLNAELGKLEPTIAAAPRIIELLNAVFFQDSINANQHLPVGLIDQRAIKKLAAELLVGFDGLPAGSDLFTPPAAPIGGHVDFTTPAFRIGPVFRAGEAMLQSALKVHNAMRNRALTKKDATIFVKFRGMFSAGTSFSETNEDDRYTLFTELQNLEPFGYDMNTTLLPNLKVVLEKTRPLDIPQWPLPTHPGESFNTFVLNMMRPLIEGMADEVTAARDPIPYRTNTLRSLATAAQILRNDALDPAAHGSLVHELNVRLAAYKADELGLHGLKQGQASVGGGHPKNYRTVTDEVYAQLAAFEVADSNRNDLLKRVCYKRFSDDPFMMNIRAPDGIYDVILAGLALDITAHNADIDQIKGLVLDHAPIALRNDADDIEFNRSFGPGMGNNLRVNNVETRQTVARVKRVFNMIKDRVERAEIAAGRLVTAARKGLEAAAEIVYGFGAENSGRCIDGKRDRLTQIELEQVYVVGGNASPDAIVGMTLSKIFLDHRMETLATSVDRLFAPGEGKTYAKYNTHRTLTLGFGLSGKYNDMHYVFNEQIVAERFIHAYVRGDTLRHGDTILGAFAGSAVIAAFDARAMEMLVYNELIKQKGSKFTPEMLTHMTDYCSLDIRDAFDSIKVIRAADPGAGRIAPDPIANDYFGLPADVPNLDPALNFTPRQDAADAHAAGDDYETDVPMRKLIRSPADGGQFVGTILRRYGWMQQRQGLIAGGVWE